MSTTNQTIAISFNQAVFLSGRGNNIILSFDDEGKNIIFSVHKTQIVEEELQEYFKSEELQMFVSSLYKLRKRIRNFKYRHRASKKNEVTT